MNQLLSKEKWKYAFYTVSHPMDAYYEIRHRERGSVPVAITLVILFAFSFSINRISAIASGYALTPMIVCFNIGTLFSRYVTLDEGGFYYMIIAFGVAYSLIMALMGIMQVHNYTLGKTLVTIFLTFVAMLIIIFVVLLFVDLITQVYSFFYSIYQELIFRL